MARWEPGAGDRLRSAAVRLFAERGFEATTAADIAREAGLNERTFFRHFKDKREVLFHDQEGYLAGFLEPIHAAADDATPAELVAAALQAGAARFTDEHRPHAVLRGAIIAETPSLQERERHKAAALAGRLAEALRARGVGEPTASLAGESGATVFGLAFVRWVAEGEERSLGEVVADTWSAMLALGSS